MPQTGGTIPDHLGHKPLYHVADYELLDQPFYPDTDARGLSIGLAQWDNSRIGVKVWRHTGNRWSRQSEEMPPHRAVDLTLLYCLTWLALARGRLPVTVASYGHFRLTAQLTTSNPDERDLRFWVLERHLEKEGEYMRDRLNALADVLADMKAAGLI